MGFREALYERLFLFIYKTEAFKAPWPLDANAPLAKMRMQKNKSS
jgi:hypothetical protein